MGTMIKIPATLDLDGLSQVDDLTSRGSFKEGLMKVVLVVEQVNCTLLLEDGSKE